MKKALICYGLAAALLSSCALLERSPEAAEYDPNKPPFEPSETASTLEQLAGTPGSLETEISRINTKVSALETKLDVLTANMERLQLQRSQPVIEASVPPQMNMAAPVQEHPVDETEPPVQISAAPARPVVLPTLVKSPAAKGSEREFQSAMELFQSGSYLEAASKFALFARKYPRHLMASHALYWAGESSARGKQWGLAAENWEELERSYPRSAYLPDALAGLARAHEIQGNNTKATAYRSTLLRAFPKSPVALSLQLTGAQETAPAGQDPEDIPVFNEEGAVSE